MLNSAQCFIRDNQESPRKDKKAAGIDALKTKWGLFPKGNVCEFPDGSTTIWTGERWELL